MYLPKFIADRIRDFGWGQGSAVQLQGANFDNHLVRMVEALPDPEVERYTRAVGVHNVLEMSKFLDILGDQKIQITVRNKGKVLTSYVMETTRDKVKYIQVVPEKKKGATIDFEVDLQDLRYYGQVQSTPVDGLKTALNLLASNKGFRRKLNLLKLLIAGGAETIRYYRNKNNRRSKRNGKGKAA